MMMIVSARIIIIIITMIVDCHQDDVKAGRWGQEPSVSHLAASTSVPVPPCTDVKKILDIGEKNKDKIASNVG